MSLIVEDGSGVAGAESYISVSDADTYHTNRGNSAWTGTSKEAALRKATDYMLQAYRQRWKGLRMQAAQALDWPRAGVEYDPSLLAYVAVDVVPTEVKSACAELALVAISSDLNPDLSRGVLSEQIGPIQVTYDKASPQYTRFRRVDMLLEPFLTSGAPMAPLVRV